MKLFFFLFLVVFLWRDNYALKCVDYDGELSFAADQLDEIKKFVDDLGTTGENEVCSVQYVVTYPEKNFTLLFGYEVSDIPGDANTDVFTQIEIIMADNGSAIDPGVGTRTFAFKCDDEDACERHFWRNHIDLLVEEDSTLFETEFRPVLIHGIQQQVQCKVKNGADQGTCSGGTCILAPSNVGQGVVRGCADENLHETSVKLAHLAQFFEDDRGQNGVAMGASALYFGYACQFDYCNDQSSQNEISNTMSMENLGLVSVYDAFVATLEEKQSTEPPSESSTTTIGQSDASTSVSPQPGSTADNPSPSGQTATTTFNPTTATTFNPTTTTTFNPTTTATVTTSTTSTTSNSTETSRPNASIVHFISLNILILHLVFLFFF